MDENLNKKISIKCIKHGEFNIDSNVHAVNQKDKILGQGQHIVIF